MLYDGVRVRQGYKYRLKPDAVQSQKFGQFAGCCRFVWNKGLAVQKERLAAKEPLLKYVETAKRLTGWRKEPELFFLADAPTHPMQQTLRDLDRAFKDAFDKNQPNKRFPVFKKKGLGDSFRYPDPKQFKLAGNRVFLPKVGWVRFFKSREILGKPKNVTVSRQGKHWFVSIQTERVIDDPVHPSGSMVGIDLGVKRFAALSTGEFVDPVNSFKRLQEKLAREQRRLARKKKFSANWRKQKARISALHTKIANVRNDFLHKVSTTISKNHAMIVMEDLHIRNMSASAKGSVGDPGKNVRQKAGLNRSILDQGWGNFRRMLEYKQGWNGGEVMLVPAMYTSQRCPECGHVDKDNRRSQAVFKCVTCGYEKNADLNAANNILAAGHAVFACGGTGAGHPMKQEPLAA